MSLGIMLDIKMYVFNWNSFSPDNMKSETSYSDIIIHEHKCGLTTRYNWMGNFRLHQHAD